MQTFSKPCTDKKTQLFWREFYDQKINLTSYKLPELRRFARENGLFVSGTKQLIIERLSRHFRLVKTTVWLQALFRGNQLRRIIGPAFYKRQMCVNDTDFFTLERIDAIDPSDFFSYTDDHGFTYGFDVNSLAVLFSKQTNPTNPYNRDVFSSRVLRTIRGIVKPMDSHQHVYEYLDERRRLTTDVRIREVFIEIDRLGNYTESSWFSELHRERYIYFFIVLREIWDWRSGMSDNIKRAICPHFNPFQYGLGILNVSLVDTENEHLLSLSDCQTICLTVIENLIYTGTSDEHKNLITAHILSVLTLVSIRARNSMRWLYESILDTITS